MEWPQGAPDKITAITTGDKIGMYKPGEPGTKNVKADVDELKAFFQGDLAADIQTNADNITNNTSAIGLNASQIATNKTNIESNDADILALQTKTPQSYKTTDSPTFADIILSGFGAIKSTIQNAANWLNQGVKTSDSPNFESVKATNGAYVYTISTTKGAVYSAIAGYLSDGETCCLSGSIVETGTIYLVSRATRSGSTVTIHATTGGGSGISTLDCPIGDTGTVLNVSLCTGIKI